MGNQPRPSFSKLERPKLNALTRCVGPGGITLTGSIGGGVGIGYLGWEFQTAW